MKRKKSCFSVKVPSYGFIVNIFYSFSPEKKAFYATQNQHGSRFEKIYLSEMENLKIISDIDEMHSNDIYDRE